MQGRTNGFRRLFRRRRRRFWRYVSPQRRSTGLVLLALLMLAVYGYWYATNGQRVRRIAESYLRELTGAEVSVRDATFRVFGNVELEGVSLRLPGEASPEPLFQARRVVLSHKPWDMLLRGRFHITEITCVEPVVNIEYYSADSNYCNVAKLATLVPGLRPGGGGIGSGIPPIRVRNCKVRVYRGAARAFQGELSLAIALAPAQGGLYSALVEEEGKKDGRLHFEGTYNPSADPPFAGVARGPILVIAPTLPPTYAEWLKANFTRGNFSTTWGGQSAGGNVEVLLSDAALKLPAEMGPGDLEAVSGKIMFLPDKGLRFEKLIGRLGAGGARLELNGRYRGEGKDADYDLHIEGWDVTIPTLDGKGELADILRDIHDTYAPAGKIEKVDLTLQQASGKPRVVRGGVRVNGLSVRYKQFPYPMEGMTGDVAFTDKSIRFDGLRARHGGTIFTLSGWADQAAGGLTYDITILSENLPTDPTLRAALKPSVREVYDRFSPQGAANVRTRLRQAQGQPEEVTLTFLGGASLTASHDFFPYRVQATGGSVFIRGDQVVIPDTDEHRIRAHRGGVEVAMHGRVDNADSDKPSLDFTIQADNVPLDEALAGALQPGGRESLAALNARGVLRNIVARIRQSGGADADYTVTTRLEDLGFQFNGFPYAVTDAACKLKIASDGLTVSDLQGRHGPADIRLNGRFLFGPGNRGADLQMDVANLVCDDELLAALGPEARRMWKLASPGGIVDVRVAKLRDNGAKDDPLDYEIILRPRDMSIGYERLPYRFHVHGAPLASDRTEKPDEARGVVVLRPGVISIQGLKSAPGGTECVVEKLDARIAEASGATDVKLTMKASNLPLDAARLEAIRKAGLPLTSRLSPGGSFDIDIRELQITSSPGNDARAASGPAVPGHPAPRSAGTRVRFAGQVGFKDAVVSFGLGETRLTGVIKASAVGDDSDLAFQGSLEDLDLTMGQGRRIRHVKARFDRPPGKPLQVQDISCEAYGGRVEGAAIIDIEEPARYRLQTNFEGFKLAELLGAAGKKGADDLQGVVDGSMEMSGTVGDEADRRASGQVRISHAKLVHVPVLLSLMQVVTLSLPKEGPFAQGLVDYEMKGNTVVFREIHLGGAGASLVGSGKLDLQTGKLNLTFLRATGALPRLASIEELLQGILREIAEIRVTGTLDKPEVRTVPLRSIRVIIETLTRPEQAGA